MVSLYGALAADRLLFNSAWNRDSFLAGANRCWPGCPTGSAGIVDKLSAPGLGAAGAGGCRRAARQKPGERLQLVWNHRWEYDKGPGAVAGNRYRPLSGARCRMHVVGQQFREHLARVCRQVRDLLKANAEGGWGFVEHLADYLRVLSPGRRGTVHRLHDFQGLSVLEACRLGASPVVPDDLVYPEWFGSAPPLRTPARLPRCIDLANKGRWRACPGRTPSAVSGGCCCRATGRCWRRWRHSQPWGNSVS